jgi:hypothetical protein
MTIKIWMRLKHIQTILRVISTTIIIVQFMKIWIIKNPSFRKITSPSKKHSIDKKSLILQLQIWIQHNKLKWQAVRRNQLADMTNQINHTVDSLLIMSLRIHKLMMIHLALSNLVIQVLEHLTYNNPTSNSIKFLQHIGNRIQQRRDRSHNYKLIRIYFSNKI